MRIVVMREMLIFLGVETILNIWGLNRKRDEKMYKKFLILAILLILSACSLFGSYYEPEAVGIGKDVNELKLSPCACMQVEVIKNVPDWFWETI